MMNLTPQQAFNRVYGSSKNFMTPDIIRYETTRHYFIEVSSGEGVFDKDQLMYGVTVITKELEKRGELSKCCHSTEEIEEYINTLK